MKSVNIPKLKASVMTPSMEEISLLLESQGITLPVDTVNWETYNYRPDVKVTIAYNSSEIFLKYHVTEEYFKAEMTESNQNVYEDSCVEFFVSPADDNIYYNFEFNALGTCLIGSGTARENSRRVDPAVISKIRRLGSAGKEPVKEKQGRYEWWLTVAIPFEVFFHHDSLKPEGKTFRANFYKCGDGLKVQHYLTWNPVGTRFPDFHQPAFFGTLNFL
jgi:hypothetical protein